MSEPGNDCAKIWASEKQNFLFSSLMHRARLVEEIERLNQSKIHILHVFQCFAGSGWGVEANLLIIPFCLLSLVACSIEVKRFVQRNNKKNSFRSQKESTLKQNSTLYWAVQKFRPHSQRPSFDGGECNCVVCAMHSKTTSKRCCSFMEKYFLFIFGFEYANKRFAVWLFVQRRKTFTRHYTRKMKRAKKKGSELWGQVIDDWLRKCCISAPRWHDKHPCASLFINQRW